MILSAKADPTKRTCPPNSKPNSASPITTLHAANSASWAPKPSGAHLETNIIFDAPNKSLFSANKALRLRISRDINTGKEHAVLTYKGPRTTGQFKSREEIESGVDDPNAMLDILKALNFVQVLSFQKKRESWEFDGCKIELDELPHLGLFLEIEGPPTPPSILFRKN